MDFEIGSIRAMVFAGAAFAILAATVSWVIRRSDARLFGTSRLAVLAIGLALLMIGSGVSVWPKSIGESFAVAGFFVLVLGVLFDRRFRNETAD